MLVTTLTRGITFLARETEESITLEYVDSYEDRAGHVCVTLQDVNASSGAAFSSVSCYHQGYHERTPACVTHVYGVTVPGTSKTLYNLTTQCCSCKLWNFTRAIQRSALRSEVVNPTVTIFARTSGEALKNNVPSFTSGLVQFDASLPVGLENATVKLYDSTQTGFESYLRAVSEGQLPYSNRWVVCGTNETDLVVDSIEVPMPYLGVTATRDDYSSVRDGFQMLFNDPVLPPISEAKTPSYHVTRLPPDDIVRVPLPSSVVPYVFRESSLTRRCDHANMPGYARGLVAVLAKFDNNAADYKLKATKHTLKYTFGDFIGNLSSILALCTTVFAIMFPTAMKAPRRLQRFLQVGPLASPDDEADDATDSAAPTLDSAVGNGRGGDREWQGGGAFDLSDLHQQHAQTLGGGDGGVYNVELHLGGYT